MVSAKTVVTNKSGLHLRPATEFSRLCSQMKCDVTIVTGTKRINPKSVLMLMSAGITKGTEIEIITSGENEEENLQILLDAIGNGLGEGE